MSIGSRLSENDVNPSLILSYHLSPISYPFASKSTTHNFTIQTVLVVVSYFHGLVGMRMEEKWPPPTYITIMQIIWHNETCLGFYELYNNGRKHALILLMYMHSENGCMSISCVQLTQIIQSYWAKCVYQFYINMHSRGIIDTVCLHN